MKRIVIYTLAGGAVLLSGLMVGNAVYADDTASKTIPAFIQSVADKLGIEGTDLFNAMEEVRTEEREEIRAETEAKISEAVENGELTERQAQLLDAMHEIRDAKREEVIASGEKRNGVMRDLKDEMVTLLNEAGLNTTQEELDELHTTLQALGIGGGMDGGRGMGKGDGMGGGNRECMVNN